MGRLRHAWNAFVNLDRQDPFYSSSVSYGQKPDRTRLRFANERSIIASIYNRLAMDVSALAIKHVRLDDKDRFESVVKSGLNECFTVEANIDQAARAFRQDI